MQNTDIKYLPITQSNLVSWCRLKLFKNKKQIVTNSTPKCKQHVVWTKINSTRASLSLNEHSSITLMNSLTNFEQHVPIIFAQSQLFSITMNHIVKFHIWKYIVHNFFKDQTRLAICTTSNFARSNTRGFRGPRGRSPNPRRLEGPQLEISLALSRDIYIRGKWRSPYLPYISGARESPECLLRRAIEEALPREKN